MDASNALFSSGRYRAELEGEVDAIVQLTAQLVAIDSPTDHPDGIADVVERLADTLREQGLETTVTPLDGHGPVLEARARLGPGRRVLLLGHADTVWPVGTAASWPFAQDERRRLTGPGVGDMKVCLAVATFALGALVRSRPPGIGELILLVVPDEEAGSVATRSLIETAARAADACLTLEAAREGGGIVTSRGAVGAMHVRATGRSQHVTDPTPHANALTELLRLGPLIEAEEGATVGVMRAGTARQLVPGEGELLIDLRAPSTAEADALARRVAAHVAGRPVAEGVTLEVSGGTTRPAWERSDATAVLFAEAQSAAAAIGISTFEVSERGGSDASFAGALGVPTLDGLGPPCVGSCSRAESVLVDDLAAWGAILCAVAAAVGGRSQS